MALPLILTVWLGGAAGCHAQVAAPGPPSLLHQPVAVAPALTATQQRLWVALAAHLSGPGQLSLRSAGGSLRLSDASGQAAQAPRLTLRWSRRPLPTPLLVRRLVLGPFASFESAEAVAQRWRSRGASPVLARPDDWEVWAAPGSPALAGQAPRLVERRALQAWVPLLSTGSGTRALRGPIRIEAPGGLLWNGGVFAGPFLLQSDAHGGWTLVEQVPLERYLLGVVPHEIGPGAPPAALAAQAVLARTWALRNQHRFAVDGYHLCADTQCQVYADPRHAGAAVSRAVAATAGRVLAWQGRPIHAVYHATNGGVSAAFEEVWSGSPLPYLQAALDGPSLRLDPLGLSLPLDATELSQLLRSAQAGHGADHPRFRWERQLDGATLTAAARAIDPRFGQASRVSVLERGPSGRVLALEIAGTGGSTGGNSTGGNSRVVLRRDAIRRSLRQLPSTLFVVTPAGPARWRFVGGGFGHGAGLSQAGAIDLARQGWGLERILARYYPGSQLLPLAALAGSAP
ncbi:MAG: SpoIID/LytB domain-containing protein [Cyanobacteriota bacterium]|nr:SpoIID/LytB domain-containing protein [Cyanobacteriota bacterium]